MVKSDKKNSPGKDKQLISLVICGEAGHGIQTVEMLLTRIFKLGGLNVFATKEYMSRVRGESNSTQIIVSSKKVPVSYTHLRAHETPEHLVCRLLLEKK